VTNQWIDIVPYGSEASFWQGTQPYEEIEDTESTIYNALPCHPITFTQPYAMMKYEVSVSEHWRCVAAGACTDPAPCWSGSAHDPSDPRLANHPVICISTDHAEDYCAWVGGRLPSEAEWEYAATKADSCVPHLNYPWGVGGIDGDIANYLGGGNPFAATEAPFTQSGGPTTPVGFFDGSLRTREESQWIGGPDSFQTRNNASPFGLYDMSGNVAEWTLDCWNENYEGKPHLDGAPWVEGDSDCALRVKRGDGWSDVEQALTTYFRAPRTPFANKNFLGVRCVRALHEANQ
jgi:formylglycine-generating enzyme required for sulfatase activity